MKRAIPGCVLGILLAVTVLSAPDPSWLQWARDAQHSGFIDIAGPRLGRIVADVVYDPLVPQEVQGARGALLVHYQVPLVDGSDVFMASKTGEYSKGEYATQRWHQNRWSSGWLKMHRSGMRPN